MTAGTRPRGIGVSLRGVVHIYRATVDGADDRVALSHVDLDVAAGEMVCVLGPSGSGKSTVLALLAGVLQPSAGRVLVGAHDLARLGRRDIERLRGREIATVLQNPAQNLVPYATVRQNLRWAAGTGPDRLDADELLGLTGLAPIADTRVAALSGGEQQRAAVAAAVCAGPRLVLADEPTSHLDAGNRDAVVDLLVELNRLLGATIIVVTHDPDVARWMPRTITIRDGRIGGEGRSGEEYAVVTADGFLPLPAHVFQTLPAGTLVRMHLEDGEYRLQVEHGPEGESIDLGNELGSEG